MIHGILEIIRRWYRCSFHCQRDAHYWWLDGRKQIYECRDCGLTMTVKEYRST